MLFISSRKQLSNEDRIGPQDEFFDIRIQRGMMTSHKPLNGIADIRQAIKNKKVLILIHGYNNEFEDVVRAYGLIEEQTQKFMKKKYDLVIGYTWPGGDSRFEYFAAKTRAGVVAPRFSQTLRELHSASTRAAALDIMTHSMGARVALEALKHLSTRDVVRNIMHMAAAVDNESIENDQEYFVANRRARNSFVFHSRHDQVLNLAYRAAEWDRALGQHGPEDPADIINHSKHTRFINCKRVIRAHGDYKGQDAIYKYLNSQVNDADGPQFTSL